MGAIILGVAIMSIGAGIMNPDDDVMCSKDGETFGMDDILGTEFPNFADKVEPSGEDEECSIDPVEWVRASSLPPFTRTSCFCYAVSDPCEEIAGSQRGRCVDRSSAR